MYRTNTHPVEPKLERCSPCPEPCPCPSPVGCQVEAGNLELGAKSKLRASLGVNQGALIRPARRHFATRNITHPRTAHHQFQTRISSSLCARTGKRTQVLYVLCVKRFFAPTRNRIRHAGCHCPASPVSATPLIRNNTQSQLAHLRIRPRRRYARSLESLSLPWPPPSPQTLLFVVRL
jgi:hypothetical protein